MKNYYFKLFASFIFMLFFINSIYSQNNPPTFTSTAVTSVNYNATYSYTITTNDVDNDAVTLTAPTLPSWLSLTTNTTVSTLAGSGASGFANATGTAAQFKDPKGVAVDASGTIYVADSGNNRIRKITPAGVVTTFAGSGIPGITNGSGSGLFPDARFNSPRGLAVDGSGTVYVADLNNNSIRKITPLGISSTVVTTLAGGIAGFADGTGNAAKFSQPKGVAVDASGTVYVADYGNHRIRKITTAKVVTTLAGTGTFGFADGAGSVAQFNYPTGIAVDGSGNVYVADKGNHCIRKITPAGVVSTFAGSTTAGSADGTGTAAQFFYPISLVVDTLGTVYVADSGNDRIRKITSAGVVTTLAGSTAGFVDGTGSAAKFNFPHGVTVDGSGTVYVADYINQRIRKITVSTDLTGDTTSQAGTHNVVLNANDGNGGSTDQSFTITVSDVTVPTLSSLLPADNASGIAINSNLELSFSENIQKGTGNILIKDAADNSTVQTIDVTTSAVSISNAIVTINPPVDLLKSKNYYIQIPATAFTDTSSNAFAGIADTTTWNFATELNTAPTFTSTAITSIDENQTYSYTIATADADGDAVTLTAPTLPAWLSFISTATVTTFAGFGLSGFADGTGTAALFASPVGVAIDGSGTIYIADQNNQRIRKITPTGMVTTLAGSNIVGFADGTGTAAKFNFPSGVAVDASGTVYVADQGNHRIRKITAAGVVTTFAGSGVAGFDNGTGTLAQFQNPLGIAIDGSGTVYVADFSNNRIRKITAAGVVTTLAGSGAAGLTDGTGAAALFNGPSGVAVNAFGTVYVADTNNHRIRKITPAGVVTTLAGSTQGFADGTGTAAQFNLPINISVDALGTVYVADEFNHRIRKITPAGVVTTLAGSTQGSINGTGTAAKFNFPRGVAVDGSGIVYVADTNNHRIRKIVQKGLTGDTTGQAGTHNVVLNANDGNGGSTNQSFTITVNSTLGIDSNIIKGFKLYPNPINDKVTITAQEVIKQLSVFNLLGQKVSQKITNNTQVDLDLSVLSKGVYFIKVTTDKTTKSVKIIKR